MKKERRHTSLLMWGGVVLLVVILALCSGIFYASVKNQLFQERREHLSELTIKISEILNTEMSVMQQKADAAQNLMNMGSETNYASTGEMLESVRKILEIDNGELLAVNTKSTFYTSSGYYARWSTPEDLDEEDGIPMIRELTFHGNKDTYMIFMRVIADKAAYDEEGNALTHIIVAIPLSNMEDEFTITGFGENIFTYMINSSGRRLYKQTYSNTFIEEFNVLTALKDYKFSEDGAEEIWRMPSAAVQAHVRSSRYRRRGSGILSPQCRLRIPTGRCSCLCRPRCWARTVTILSLTCGSFSSLSLFWSRGSLRCCCP
jgi:hypothetical protein